MLLSSGSKFDLLFISHKILFIYSGILRGYDKTKEKGLEGKWKCRYLIDTNVWLVWGTSSIKNRTIKNNVETDELITDE